MAIGFALAMLSMVFFGVYMVPRKFCGLKNLEFVLSMGAGVLLTTLAGWSLHHRDPNFHATSASVMWSFLCGPVWTLGMVAFTLAVAEMGLALATPIKNTTAVMGSLVGLLFFGETQTTVAWMALVGSAFIVFCAIVIGQTGDENRIKFSVSGKGILYSLLAAFFFAAYTYPLKVAMGLGLDSYTIIFVMALGILATALAGLLFWGGSLTHWRKQPFKDHLFGALAGVLWALATMLMNAAIARIGLAVTWPITNLNTIVAVFIGAYLFHEVHIEKHRRKIVLGMIYASIGVLLLGLSKF